MINWDKLSTNIVVQTFLDICGMTSINAVCKFAFCPTIKLPVLPWGQHLLGAEEKQKLSNATWPNVSGLWCLSFSSMGSHTSWIQISLLEVLIFHLNVLKAKLTRHLHFFQVNYAPNPKLVGINRVHQIGTCAYLSQLRSWPPLFSVPPLLLPVTWGTSLKEQWATCTSLFPWTGQTTM